MKAIVIVNPAANYGLAAKWSVEARDRVVRQLNAEWVETNCPMEAAELACNAARQGFQYVFAAGGDGTVNEVLNGLMKAGLGKRERPVLGIIPLGSGNDFYSSLEANRQTVAAAHLAGTEAKLWVDVGHVTFDGYQRYFCLGVGVGFIGWANIQRLKISRRVKGHLGYLLASAVALLTYSLVPDVKIAFNEAPYELEQVASMIMVSNGSSVGGGFKITPDANIDDGQFDICIVDHTARWQLARLILQARSGSHIHSREVRIIRASQISITASRPLPVHVDGELPPEVLNGVRHINVKVVPAELRVIALRLPVGSWRT